MPRISLAFCWCFADEVTPEVGLAHLSRYGFTAIELWPPALRRWGVARWRAALQASGMACVQLCPYFDFVHGPVGVEMGRSVLNEYLDAARELGCRRLRTFTGPPWGRWMVGPKDADEQQWQDTIDGLQLFCDHAAQDGVELCLECHDGSLMEDSPATERLLQGVSRTNLTVNLQLPLVGETWETSVQRLGRHCTHIHIHNWAEGFGVGPWTRLSEGQGDWEPPLRAILAINGGDLCLSLEHATHGGRDPFTAAQVDGPWLQALRQRLEDQ
jgi:sugar phosphate isomerase/epimerase